MRFSPQNLVILGLLLFSLFGCGKLASDSPTPGTSVTPERAACSASLSITDPVTITGAAQFQARPVRLPGYSGFPYGGLDDPGPAKGVAFAEVEVLNSAGESIQCGATDANGNLVATDLSSPLRINKAVGTFTVRVNSRASNSKINVSIVNNPTANLLYSVTGGFSLQGIETTKAVSITTASAIGTLEGGAFNILYQIYLANEYLRNHSSCPSLPANEAAVCSAFTVAPKIKVFWAPGVDPGTAYLGLSYPISAYLRTSDPNTKGLYILGGKSGDFDCTDTDHFDNSVILHEYGHFLEEFFAKSDSPGGSHNGNGIIDPRLAWSEGWANFFQAAVLGSPYYSDTIRTKSCASGTKLQINLKLDEKTTDTYSCSSGTQPTMTHGEDIPTFTNEGTYREVDVTRTLYQMILTSNSTPTGQFGSVTFDYVWRAFNSSANGLASSSNHFRNSGILNASLKSLLTANSVSTTGFNNVMTYEKQPSSAASYYYGQTVTAKACALTPFSITGGAVTELKADGTAAKDCNNQGFTLPSLQQNNNFLRYDWGGGNLTLNLKYTSAGTPDLNLYIYQESHSLYDLSTMVGYSATLRSSETISGGYHVETVNIPSLPAGTYMIQVEMDDSNSANYNGVTANYMLTLGSGATLCL